MTASKRLSWRDDAACVGEELDVFFPVGTTGDAVWRLAEAKQICAGCTVRDACLQWALQVGVDDGVFGGLDARERRAVRWTATRRRRRPSVAAPDLRP